MTRTLSNHLLKSDSALHVQQSLNPSCTKPSGMGICLSVMNGSVCHCSSQDQSPVAIHYGRLFYCAALCYHYPHHLCCIVWPSGVERRRKCESLIPTCGRLNRVRGCQIEKPQLDSNPRLRYESSDLSDLEVLQVPELSCLNRMVQTVNDMSSFCSAVKVKLILACVFFLLPKYHTNQWTGFIETFGKYFLNEYL